MRKRQCVNCDEGGCNGISQTEFVADKGKVISVRNTTGKLPGLGDNVFPVRVYNVECSKCGHTWRYRKKVHTQKHK